MLETIMQERRQNVRVRPAADYDIGIDLEDGLVKVRLSVLDAAVGGVGLVVDALFADKKANATVQLGVSLPGVPRFLTPGNIRYTQGRAGGRCGVHFPELTAEQQTALSKAISELLERGHSA
jgi:hypothetical protein